MKDILKLIELKLRKVQLPWTASTNVPFYADIRKPRPSLSKHDGTRPSYWHINDAEYMLLCVNEMPAILEYIKKLQDLSRPKPETKL